MHINSYSNFHDVHREPKEGSPYLPQTQTLPVSEHTYKGQGSNNEKKRSLEALPSYCSL